MRKVWKWVIGIVLGLIVVGVLVSVGIFVHRYLGDYRSEIQVSQGFSEGGQENFRRGPGWMPYGGFDHMGGPEMMPYGGFGHIRGPGMMGYGWSPFGGLIGGLFSLVFLALVVLGIIWLVKHFSARKPAEGVPAGLAVPAVGAAIVNPCKKCGRPLQEDWNVCPHCGKKV